MNHLYHNTSVYFLFGIVIFLLVFIVLAVCFFAKVALVYMDYRKHGQLEWTPPTILFATLVFALTAPLYIWDIIGM